MNGKIVPENLEELNEWTSSDTGVELYTDNFLTPDEDAGDVDISDLTEEDIDELVPPPDFQFTTRSFAEFVNQLIKAMPENPFVISRIFSRTLEKHPYLTRKGIGFHSSNPYEESIRRFIKISNKI